MRRIILALLALSLSAGLAWAYNPMTELLPSATPDGRKPIAWVYDSDVFDSLFATGSAGDTTTMRPHRRLAQSIRQVENWDRGRFFQNMRERGQRVDVYPSSVFKPKGAKAALWATLGDSYAAVICYGFNINTTGSALLTAYLPDTAALHRFFDPESCSAQIIHYDNPSMLSENPMPLSFGTGTFLPGGGGGMVNPMGNNTSGGDGTNISLTTNNGDSLFCTNFIYGSSVVNSTICPTCGGTDSTHSRVASIRRILNPPRNVATWPLFTSNNTLFRADSANVIYADSVVHLRHECLPVAWRVFWKEGRHVDYVGDYMQYPRQNIITSQYLLADVARYAKVDPIRVGYEWDDHGNFGRDNSVDSTSRNWPYPDTLSAFMRMLSRYNVIPNGIATTGGADSLQLMASTVQDGKIYPYLKDHSWSFVQHTHDSTDTDMSTWPLGMGQHIMGGYSINHRLAFRDSLPGSDDATHYGYMSKGIYQRLVRSDSAFTANFGRGSVAPYLSFPNDASMCLDTYFSNQPTTSSLWHGITTGSSVLDVPQDSLMLALAAAGKHVIRGYVDGQSDSLGTNGYSNGLAFAGAGNKTFRWVSAGNGTWDTTPSSASTANGLVERFFSVADERWVGHVSPSSWLAKATGAGPAGNYEVRCVGTTALSTTGTIDPTKMNQSKFYADSQYQLPQVLGLISSAVNSARPCTDIVGGMNGGYSPYANPCATVKTFMDAGWEPNTDTYRVRMLYQHPLSTRWGGALHQLGYTVNLDTYPVDMIALRVGVLDPLRALEDMAGGNRLVQWCKPWEVYNK